jgi:hypothetical protein
MGQAALRDVPYPFRKHAWENKPMIEIGHSHARWDKNPMGEDTVAAGR